MNSPVRMWFVPDDLCWPADCVQCCVSVGGCVSADLRFVARSNELRQVNEVNVWCSVIAAIRHWHQGAASDHTWLADGCDWWPTAHRATPPTVAENQISWMEFCSQQKSTPCCKSRGPKIMTTLSIIIDKILSKWQHFQFSVENISLAHVYHVMEWKSLSQQYCESQRTVKFTSVETGF